MQTSIDSLDDSSVEPNDTRSSGSGGGSSGLRQRLGRVFSPKTFLVDLVVVLVGVGLASGIARAFPIPFFGSIGGLVGLFAATFLLGVVRSRRQYLEVTLAGATSMALSALLSTLTAGFFLIGVSLLERYGVAIVVGAALLGAVLSLVGYYFGRDLRDGLTQEI